MVTYTASARNLEFKVPKAWSHQAGGMPPELAEKIFSFYLDNGGGARKGKQSAGFDPTLPNLAVGITEPCESQEQLTKLVNDTRDGMARMDPERKLVEDRAIEVNGEPAWLLRWESPPQGIAVKMRGADGVVKDKEIGPKVVRLRQKVLFVRNKTICDVGLFAERETFHRLLPVADAVAASIAPVPK